MFPLTSNEPYIKETGERSTLGAMLGGGSSVLPEYTETDAGKVLTVDSEGDLQWETPTGSDLPEYDSEDAGKVLAVDDNGDLVWVNVEVSHQYSVSVSSAAKNNVEVSAEEVTT